VAAATSDHDAADGVAAAPAGFPGMLVHPQLAEECARAALDVEVIAEGRSSQPHGAVQHLADGHIELVSLGGRNAAGLGERMDARLELSCL